MKAQNGNLRIQPQGERRGQSFTAHSHHGGRQNQSLQGRLGSGNGSKNS